MCGLLEKGGALPSLRIEKAASESRGPAPIGADGRGKSVSRMGTVPDSSSALSRIVIKVPGNKSGLAPLKLKPLALAAVEAARHNSVMRHTRLGS